MKFILAAALAVFSTCAIAADRYKHSDMSVEPEVVPGGKYVNYKVEGGECLGPAGLQARIAAIGVDFLGKIPTPNGLILVFGAPDNSYGEGWLISGEVACLYIVTLKAGASA